MALLSALALFLACLTAPVGLHGAEPVDFEKDIAPVLEEKCFLCHGGDTKKPKAGLRLDSRASIEGFSAEKPLLVPGDPLQSSLFNLVSLPHDSEEIMPPPGKKTPLSAQQIITLRRWIEEGASFGSWKQSTPRPVSRDPDPAELPRTEEDATRAVETLLEAGRRKAGVSGSAPVAEEVFVRRAYLDIAGRIPTEEEARAFLDSPETPDKRTALIDRLLESDGHVSHFYNYWADVLRIRDGRWGQEAIRAFREWLKGCLRANRPWDRIVSDILTATGNCLENPAVGYWYRDYQMPLDNLAFTSQVLLATQLDCAVCHNHPFDKWSQREFFSFAAFLNEPQYAGYMPGWVTADELLRGVPFYKQFPVEIDGKTVLEWRELPPRENPQKKAEFAEMLKTMSVEQIAKARGESAVGYAFKEYLGNWAGARVELESTRRKNGYYPTDSEGERRYSAARFILQVKDLLDFKLRRQGRERAKLPDNYRYDDARPGEWVPPAVPFGKAPARAEGQTIEAVLASWMTAPDNPKFTKTIANRLFSCVFGIGLYPVHDSIHEDEPSAHPELTALLEALMRQGGYDMRRFLRILYHTPTYQSAVRAPHTGSTAWPPTFDGPPMRRASAEQFWDSLVTLSLPKPDQRTSFYRYRDPSKWKDLNLLRPESLLERGLQVVDEEYRMRLIEAVDPASVHYTFKAPLLTPCADYRGYPEELARASELPQPVTADHFLRMFGASDREMIENSDRSTTVPQCLALMNRLVDQYILAPPNPRHSFPGSPVEKILARECPIPEKVESLYLAILSRRPSPDEKILTRKLQSAEDLRDLVWALVNGEEFRFLR